MKRRPQFIIWVLSFFLTTGFVEFGFGITVMTYNVENLFDSTHDEGTVDWTYLPLAFKQGSPEVQKYCAAMSPGKFKEDCLNLDWTESIYRKKLVNIATVIKSVGGKKAGPDIVVLEEVENIGVLDEMANNALSGLGYRYRALIEGDDSRGIDIGVISRYPIDSARHHSTFMNGKKLKTRGVLEVEVNVKGKKVVIFGNHWPSQSNPVAQRIASAELVAALASQKSGEVILAVGDFNTISSDSPYPFDRLVGFVDSESEARKVNPNVYPGTYCFKGNWNSLDKIFVSRNSKVTPQWNTYNIIAEPWMLKPGKKEFKEPLPFDEKSGAGYSDHLPVVIQFSLGAGFGDVPPADFELE